MKKMIAKELVRVAKNLVASTVDVKDIIDKGYEVSNMKEIYQKEKNKLMLEVEKELASMGYVKDGYNSKIEYDYRQLYNEFAKNLADAIEDYFNQNGLGVKRKDIGSLTEVFIGNKDGGSRTDSKVSFMIHNGETCPEYRFRNENLSSDKTGYIPKSNSVNATIQIIDKFYKKGFWDEK